MALLSTAPRGKLTCKLLQRLTPIFVEGDGNCFYTAIAHSASALNMLRLSKTAEMKQGGVMVEKIQARSVIRAAQAKLRKAISSAIHEYGSKETAGKYHAIEARMKGLFTSHTSLGGSGVNGEGHVFSDVKAVQSLQKVKRHLNEAFEEADRNKRSRKHVEEEVWANNQETFRCLARAYGEEVARPGYYSDSVTVLLAATWLEQPIYVVSKETSGEFGVHIVNPAMDEEEADQHELYMKVDELLARKGEEEIKESIFLYRTERRVADPNGGYRQVGHFTYLCPRDSALLNKGPEGDRLDPSVLEEMGGTPLPQHAEGVSVKAVVTTAQTGAAAAAAPTSTGVPAVTATPATLITNATSSTPAPNTRKRGRADLSPGQASPTNQPVTKGARVQGEEEEEEEEEQKEEEEKQQQDQELSKSKDNAQRLSNPPPGASSSPQLAATQQHEEPASVCPVTGCCVPPPPDRRGILLCQLLTHLRKEHKMVNECTVEELRERLQKRAAPTLIVDINPKRLGALYLCKHCGHPYLQRGHEGVCAQMEAAEQPSQREKGGYSQEQFRFNTQGEHPDGHAGLGKPVLNPVQLPQDIWDLVAQLEWVNVFASNRRLNPTLMGKWREPWIDLVEPVAALAQEEKQPLYEAANKLLFMLPDFLLHKPMDPKSEPTRPAKIMWARLQRDNVVPKLRAFLQQKLEHAKKEEASARTREVSASPSDAPSTTSPSSSSSSSSSMDRKKAEQEERLASRANFMARNGCLSRATEILDPHSAPVMSMTKAGVHKIQELFPRADSAEQEQGKEMEEDRDGGEGMMDEGEEERSPYPPAQTIGVHEKVSKAFRGLDRFAAAGLTGWCKLLCPFSEALPPLDNLAAFIARVAKGLVPDACKAFLYGGRITPLAKDSGGIRPIVVGEFFVKWAAKALLIQNADRLKAVCNKWGQYGVCVENGLETIVQATKVVTELSRDAGDQDLMIAQLDCSNAYNTISRKLIRGVLAADPSLMGLLEYFDNHYPVGKGVILTVHTTDGPAQVVSEEGVHQGDPLGPVFFSLGLAQVTQLARHLTNGEAEIEDDKDSEDMAYIDDVTAMGPSRRTIMFANNFQVANEQLQAGLHLSIPKCKLWMPLCEDVSQIKRDIPEDWPMLKDIQVLGSKEGIVVLGVPIGPEDFVKEYHKTKMAECTIPHIRRLHKVGTHQLHLLLLRFCAVPRANFYLRTTEAELMEDALRGMEEEITRSLGNILGEVPSERMQQLASLPVRLGGLGLAKARQTAKIAFLASVATVTPILEYMPMIHNLIDKVADRGGPGRGAQVETNDDPHPTRLRCKY